MLLRASSNSQYSETVKVLQQKLNAIRTKVHGNWTTLRVDGYFGNQTKYAVQGFQRYMGITPVSGDVGDTTLKYVNQAYSDTFYTSVNSSACYLKASPICRYNARVKELQYKLNIIRINVHGNWPSLKIDGFYGNQTRLAVQGFQIYRNITPASGEVGETTMTYVDQAYRNTPYMSALHCNIGPQKSMESTVYQKLGEGIYQTYSLSQKSLSFSSNLNDAFEKINVYFDTIISKLNNSTLYISKHRTLGKRKIKLVIKNIQKLLKYVVIHGIDNNMLNFEKVINRKNTIDFITDMVKSISHYKVTLSKIFKACRPLLDFLNEIPGFKYISAIEKMIKATFELFHGAFLNAAKLYLDAIREIIESILIDAAVVALIASGLWVLAIALILVVFVIDYFIFSDNAGKSLVDKYTPLHTYNVVQDSIAPSLYKSINGSIEY